MALAPLAIAPIAVVASCSSGTDVNAQDFEKASKNAETFFKDNSYLLKNQKPSSFTGGNAFLALSPRQNYGFKTYAKTKDVRPSDDANGTRLVELTLERGKFSKSITFELTGFLTTAQETAEKDEDLKIENYLNLDMVGTPIDSANTNPKTVKKVSVLVNNYDKESDAPKAGEISTYLKDENKFWELFKKEVGTEKDGGAFKTLFKKALPEDKKVELKLVGKPEQKVANGVKAPIIVADVQLAKGDQRSSIVRIELGGFLINKTFINKDLLDQAATAYGNYYSPVKPGADKHNGYLDKLASTITDISDLKNQLQSDWAVFGGTDAIPVEIQVDIKSISSKDDSRGSVTVKAEFKWKNVKDEEVAKQVVEKDITLYGFKIK